MHGDGALEGIDRLVETSRALEGTGEIAQRCPFAVQVAVLPVAFEGLVVHVESFGVCARSPQGVGEVGERRGLPVVGLLAPEAGDGRVDRAFRDLFTLCTDRITRAGGSAGHQVLLQGTVERNRLTEGVDGFWEPVQLLQD